jgi:hypothetical protein
MNNASMNPSGLKSMYCVTVLFSFGFATIFANVKQILLKPEPTYCFIAAGLYSFCSGAFVRQMNMNYHLHHVPYLPSNCVFPVLCLYQQKT